MDRINQTIRSIQPPDKRIMDLTQERLDSLTKPLGSLGRLEEIAKIIAGITARKTPELKKKVIFTFAADHGVSVEGVSAFPKEVTAQMVYNFVRGGAGINVLARHVDARVVVADLGVASDLDVKEGLISKKINYGTRNMAKEAAMTEEEAVGSVIAGIDIFNQEYENGIDIIGTGEMGIANTTASSAITAVFTAKAVEEVTGYGTGIDEKSFLNKVRIIKRALEINKPEASSAMDVLAKVGGYETGGITGVILAAAAKRVPVVIDGFNSGAAALIAFGLEPKTKQYMIASHCSVEKGHRVILDYIGLKPLFDFNLRLGEGTGAALGINLCEASVKILNQMATFEGAKVSNKDKL